MIVLMVAHMLKDDIDRVAGTVVFVFMLAED